MITIKGVGVDSSFSDNVKKIVENGFNEILLPKEDINTDKFTILSIVFSPTNLGLTFNSNGGYTRHNTFRKNEDFTVADTPP